LNHAEESGSLFFAAEMTREITRETHENDPSLRSAHVLLDRNMRH
jgi:hypothetical protein